MLARLKQTDLRKNIYEGVIGFFKFFCDKLTLEKSQANVGDLLGCISARYLQRSNIVSVSVAADNLFLTDKPDKLDRICSSSQRGSYELQERSLTRTYA